MTRKNSLWSFVIVSCSQLRPSQSIPYGRRYPAARPIRSTGDPMRLRLHLASRSSLHRISAHLRSYAVNMRPTQLHTNHAVARERKTESSDESMDKSRKCRVQGGGAAHRDSQSIEGRKARPGLAASGGREHHLVCSGSSSLSPTLLFVSVSSLGCGTAGAATTACAVIRGRPWEGSTTLSQGRVSPA